MSAYTTIRIADNFYSIEQGYVRSFLIVGDNGALLVDTGIGGGNLKGYIEEITKLPITVVFTHADGDHVGDAKDFKRRLMHPSEFDYYQSKHEAAVPMEPIWEGDVIDLGNYRFEVILLPGHTPGSIALLEWNKRFLISGDSVQTGKIYMFGSGRNFMAYRFSLKKLMDRRGEFDVVYSSHYDLMVDPDYINRLYTAAGRMLEGKAEGRLEQLSSGRSVKCYEIDGAYFYAD